LGGEEEEKLKGSSSQHLSGRENGMEADFAAIVRDQ